MKDAAAAYSGAGHCWLARCRARRASCCCGLRALGVWSSVRLAPLLLHLALAQVVLQRVHRQLRHGRRQRLAVVPVGRWAGQSRARSVTRSARGPEVVGCAARLAPLAGGAALLAHQARSALRHCTTPGSRDVEAVDGVAAHGIDLRRHHIQADVLEHAHNLCGVGLCGQTHAQQSRGLADAQQGERCRPSEHAWQAGQAAASTEPPGNKLGRRSKHQQRSASRYRPHVPSSTQQQQRTPVSRPGRSIVLTSSTECEPLSCSRTSTCVWMPRRTPSGAVGSTSRVIVAAAGAAGRRGMGAWVRGGRRAALALRQRQQRLPAGAPLCSLAAQHSPAAASVAAARGGRRARTDAGGL